MARRKSSINLDEEIERKIRKLQAELIESTKINWTYSSVLSLILENGLNDFMLGGKEK